MQCRLVFMEPEFPNHCAGPAIPQCRLLRGDLLNVLTPATTGAMFWVHSSILERRTTGDIQTCLSHGDVAFCVIVCQLLLPAEFCHIW